MTNVHSVTDSDTRQPKAAQERTEANSTKY